MMFNGEELSVQELSHVSVEERRRRVWEGRHGVCIAQTTDNSPCKMKAGAHGYCRFHNRRSRLDWRFEMLVQAETRKRRHEAELERAVKEYYAKKA